MDETIVACREGADCRGNIIINIRFKSFRAYVDQTQNFRTGPTWCDGTDGAAETSIKGWRELV